VRCGVGSSVKRFYRQPESVFKTSGAGQGFRRFRIGKEGLPLKVLHVDDMVELNPFEGASNRTSAIVLQKGKETVYPMSSYLYWRRVSKGKTISEHASLQEVLSMTKTIQFAAEPVDAKDPTSPWLTGRKKAIESVRKILGPSAYDAHAGCFSGGANAVYWVNIIARRPDGLAVIENFSEGAKKKVQSVQTAVEPDLIFPLLRGRDVKRWGAAPSASIIMAQDPKTRRGINELEMKKEYPKTYLYLKSFEKMLRGRAAFKRYFTRRDKYGTVVETGPFYSMFNVSDYTFEPFKVVWREQASSVTAAVVEDEKAVPDHKLMMVSCTTEDEAYFLCALLNSRAFQYAAQAYAIEIQFDPHLIKNIAVPRFDSRSKESKRIVFLSKQAHDAARLNENEKLKSIENEIDEVSISVWGLSAEGLLEIKKALAEMDA
jgi:hypothetical protein